MLSYELARTVGARGIFMERDDTGQFVLRRGFSLEPGERVLVCEDVITTGGSVLEIVKEVRSLGAEVLGVAALVDRSGGVDLGCPLVCCIQIEIPVYDADACPLCADGQTPVKPGSRKQPC